MTSRRMRGAKIGWYDMAKSTTLESNKSLWADEARLSFLLPPEECRRLLVASGFQERAWDDTTAQAVARAHTRLASGSEEAPSGDGPPALGLRVVSSQKSVGEKPML